MTSIAERRERFAELHRSGCFVIPNPWDRGSARLLAHLGFEALATTSAGLQFSRGEPDTARGLSPEVVLTHTGLETEQEIQGHRHGWIGCLEKLATVV